MVYEVLGPEMEDPITMALGDPWFWVEGLGVALLAVAVFWLVGGTIIKIIKEK